MPINDIIKNKYIVCQSPEHGKKIIDFFVKNGAVNYYSLGEGVRNGVIYHVDELGRIDCIHKPKHYTEMQLPKEFTPKRGDSVLLKCPECQGFGRDTLCHACNFTGTTNKEIQYIRVFELIKTHIETSHVANKEWLLDRINGVLPPKQQTITKTEAEKLLGKKIEG